MIRRVREWPPALLAAAALALVGSGCVVVSFAVETDPRAAVTVADRPVNAGAREPGNIEANNSPGAARNPARPANLVVVNRVDTPDFGCGMHVSLDDGRSWTGVELPIPRGEEPKCFAPDVAFGADGTLYVSYVTLRGNGNVPHAGWIVSSRDGGRTLSRPRRVLGELAFQVRIAADARRPRTLYMSWLAADGVGLYRFERPGNPIQVARSDDGGATWSEPVRASSARRARVLAPAPAVGPRGEVYVLYLDVGNDRLDYDGAHEARGGPPHPGRFTLVLARSRDRGATWEESVVDDRVVPSERFLAFLPPFPSLAVGRDGRVYAAMSDRREGSPDVWLWSLSRGSGSWRGPTRVNDNDPDDGTSQYLPRVAVAPGGRVDVAYYDRRDDTRDIRTAVSLQSSWDDAATFEPPVRVSSRAFDSRIGFGSERGMPDLGSRIALLSDDRTARAFWADTRAGTVASNKQDIASATVAFDEPAEGADAARAALRYGGAALVFLGLALLLRAIRSRQPVYAQDT